MTHLKNHVYQIGMNMMFVDTCSYCLKCDNLVTNSYNGEDKDMIGIYLCSFDCYCSICDSIGGPNSLMVSTTRTR